MAIDKSSSEEAVARTEENCLGFLVSVGGMMFFIFDDLVSSVIEKAVITDPPPVGLPEYCIGAITVGDDSVQTVDLRLRFGVKPDLNLAAVSALILETTECKYGLVVDAVRGQHKLQAGTPLYKAASLDRQPADLSFNSSFKLNGQRVNLICPMSALGELLDERSVMLLCIACH
jgi:chemotaxis signal transduction protein